MAAGNTHFKANIVTSSTMLVGSLVFTDINSTLCSIMGSALATFYTPDIDDPGKNYFENMVKEVTGNFFKAIGMNKYHAFEVGDFVQKVYMMMTMPYAMFVKHRSWISHFPIIGTFGRFLYLDFILLLFLLLIGGNAGYTFFGSTNEYITNILNGSSIEAGYSNFYLMSMPFSCTASFITSWVINDLSHTPILDGGMYIFRRKKRYLFGKGFYELSRRIFSGK